MDEVISIPPDTWIDLPIPYSVMQFTGVNQILEIHGYSVHLPVADIHKWIFVEK